MKFKIISLFFLLFSLNLSSGAQTIPQDTTEADVSSSSDELKFTDLENTYKIQSALEQQKVYKYLFLSATLFFMLLCVLVFVFFYKRVTKIQDMTKVHVREIQLRDLRIKNLTSLLGSSAQPMLLFSVNGDIKWVNKAFMSYGFIEKEEDAEKYNFFADIAEKGERKKTADILERPKVIKYTVRVNSVQTERTVVPVTESDGEVSGFALLDEVKKS